jgi:hypothetical protein
MHTVRIRGQNYRISNETLDRVVGESWRRVRVAQLGEIIRARHDEGKLVVQGRRLRMATLAEEAEQRLRLAEAPEEILRWGLLYLGSQVTAAAAEVCSLREAVAFDESAATQKLSRDTSDGEPDLDAKLRDYRAEPSKEFVARVAARLDSARKGEERRA